METYYVTGAQLGMLLGFISVLRKDEVEKIIDEIIENQKMEDEINLNKKKVKVRSGGLVGSTMFFKDDVKKHIKELEETFRDMILHDDLNTISKMEAVMIKVFGKELVD